MSGLEWPRVLLIGVSVLVVSALLGLPGAAPAPESRASKHEASLYVVSTTEPIADMARALVGERGSVVRVAGTGYAGPNRGEARSAALDLADALHLVNADLVLANGLGFDDWLDIAARDEDLKMPIVTLSRGVAARALPASRAPSESVALAAGSPAEALDPHIWLAVPNAVQMVETMRQALIEVDPEGEQVYTANAADYTAQLLALDDWIGARIATIPAGRRTLMTNQAALGYFAECYGLTVVPVTVPDGLSDDVTTAALAGRLQIQLRRAGVSALFLEGALPPVVAERMAEPTSSTAPIRQYTLWTDRLGPAGSGADTYLGMMRQNTEMLLAGLAPLAADSWQPLRHASADDERPWAATASAGYSNVTPAGAGPGLGHLSDENRAADPDDPALPMRPRNAGEREAERGSPQSADPTPGGRAEPDAAPLPQG